MDAAEPADLTDTLAGLAPGGPIAALRRQRPEAFRHTAGSFRVLLTPDDPGGVSRQERAAIALRLAEHDHAEALAAHCHDLLAHAGGPPAETPRWAALRRHTDMLAATPGVATAADLRALEAVGLSSRDIVAVSELIAFVSYETRLLAGLRIMIAEAEGRP